jgi:hypothetical protein
MVAALITISIVLFLAVLFLLGCVIHIMKIQKELEELDSEQGRQNEDIKNLMIAHIQLINAITEATKNIKEPESIGWKKPMGEA